MVCRWCALRLCNGNVHGTHYTHTRTPAFVASLRWCVLTTHVAAAAAAAASPRSLFAPSSNTATQQPYGVDTPGPDITDAQVMASNYYQKNGTGAWSEHGDNLGLGEMHAEYAWLTFTRFILGVGVGGVYPLAATVAAESSTDNKNRGRQVSMVFSTQGIGFLLCPIVIMILTALNPSSSIQIPTGNLTGTTASPNGCLKYYTIKNTSAVEYGPAGEVYYEEDKVTGKGFCSDGANDMNWRFALALGALPGLLLLPYKVAETSNVVKDPTRKSTFWSDLGRREYVCSLYIYIILLYYIAAVQFMLVFDIFVLTFWCLHYNYKVLTSSQKWAAFLRKISTFLITDTSLCPSYDSMPATCHLAPLSLGEKRPAVYTENSDLDLI